MIRGLRLKDSAAERKHLVAPASFKVTGDAGTFSGYASIFGNVDQGGDVVERGAFAVGDMVLTKDGMIRVFNQHDSRQIIGKAKVEQDDVGLKFDGSLILSVPQARTAYELMKADVLDGMSIGYDSLEDEITNAGIRKLKRLKLWEISVVTFGMNPLAKVERVKGLAKTIREFEDQLRDAGYSSVAAKKIAAYGFKEAESQPRDVGAQAKALTELLQSIEVPGTKAQAAVTVRDVIATLRDVKIPS